MCAIMKLYKFLQLNNPTTQRTLVNVCSMQEKVTNGTVR